MSRNQSSSRVSCHPCGQHKYRHLTTYRFFSPANSCPPVPCGNPANNTASTAPVPPPGPVLGPNKRRACPSALARSAQAMFWSFPLGNLLHALPTPLTRPLPLTTLSLFQLISLNASITSDAHRPSRVRRLQPRALSLTLKKLTKVNEET